MTKKSLLILIPTSLLLLACSGLLSEESNSPDPKIAAQTSFEQQDYPTAIQQYNSAYTADSTDSEAYMGLVRSYTEQINPDSLFDTLSTLLGQEEPNPLQAFMVYSQMKQSGLFDTLATIEAITSNSPAFDSLSIEERAEIEAVRLAATSAGAADKIVTGIMNNPEQMGKLMSGDIDEEFIFTLINLQDTALVQSWMNLMQDSTLTIPGMPSTTTTP
ncbi:MAG: hypothetical protein OCC49_07535 [Fibrobacterales bacterium]